MNEILNSLKGKLLKNVVATVCVGGASIRLNVKEVHNVGETVELSIEQIDHRSREISVKCFVRVNDIAFLTVPTQEV